MAGVTALIGLPGTGKSYTAIEKFVIPALRESRHIVTNLPLILPAIEADYPGAKITIIDNLLSYRLDTVPGGAMLILDEVADLWPQGLKANAVMLEHRELINKHRHRSDETGRSMDIVLCCQDLADIANAIRGKVETTIISVKQLDLGLEDHYRRDFYRGVVTGQEGPKSRLLQSENGKYRPEVYKYYKTHMNQVEGVKPVETRIIKTSIFGSFGMKFRAVVLLICLAAIWWGLGSTSEKMDKFQGKQQPQPVQQSQPENTGQGVVIPTAKSEPKPEAGPVYSQTWRMVGYIGKSADKPDEKSRFILLNQLKHQRQIAASRCKKVDWEWHCEVDGETITRFTGGSGASYVTNEQKPVPINDRPQQRQQASQSQPTTNPTPHVVASNELPRSFDLTNPIIDP